MLQRTICSGSLELTSCGVFIAWYKVDRCDVVNGTVQVISDQQYATVVDEQNIVDV